MSRRLSLGPTERYAPGSGTLIDCSPEPLAVFNIDGNYFACGNRCPHAGGPLSDGFVRGTSVVCPWHGWDFDLSLSTEDARDGVTRYRVFEDNGELFVELP